MSSSGSVGRTETRSRDIRLLTSSERTRALEDQAYGFAKRSGASVTWTQVAAFTACALVAIVTTAVITGTIVKSGLTTNNTGGSAAATIATPPAPPSPPPSGIQTPPPPPPPSPPATPSPPTVPTTIAAFVADFEAYGTGALPLYWDAATGRLYMKISAEYVSPHVEWLLSTSFPAGLGNPDLFLDRGLPLDDLLVIFEAVGPRVFVTAPNLDFRDSSSSPLAHLVTSESFPPSVLWAFDVAIRDSVSGAFLVDATDFTVRAEEMAALLASQPGGYTFDARRSSVYLPRTKAFALNSNLEARVTFVAHGQPGEATAQVTSHPQSLTMRVQRSFYLLPDRLTNDYVPRQFTSPQAGAYVLTYVDEATPLGDDVVVRLLERHKLIKANPELPVSDPVEPIVYYVDGGAPEPILSALVDGVSWWAEAFEAAGFSNAFEVKILPIEADPNDARFNVIEYVHRATRGWSYGSAVVDPRTGEILKGHVTLGSLRARQDFVLGQGLLLPYASAGDSTVVDRITETILARLRQLGAHESGHSLLARHNFAASTQDRASVMDYPPPLITLTPGGDDLDVSDAYAVGIGAWDIWAVRFAYTEFPPGANEANELAALLREARAAGLAYIADQDARGLGAAEPRASLWDSGANPTAALEREMEVRRVALARFGAGAITDGTPMSVLETVLVPLFLHHRYQLEAAVKLVGGVHYEYAVKGDAFGDAWRTPWRAVDAGDQLAALDAVLAAIAPAELKVPAPVLALIPPPPDTYERTKENFQGATGTTFDAFAPAESLLRITFDALLAPERLSRVHHQALTNTSLPSLAVVLDRIEVAVFNSTGGAAESAYDAALSSLAQQCYVKHLYRLGSSSLSRLAMAELRAHVTNLAAVHREWAGELGAAAQAYTAAILGTEFYNPPGSPI